MEIGSSYSGMAALFQVLNIVIIIVLLYVLVLLIKLARRGIQALDIYLDEKKNGKGGSA